MSTGELAPVRTLLTNMRYHIGDEVVLKVQDGFGYSDVTYRSAKVQVVGFDTANDSDHLQYLCWVPPYERPDNTFTITRTHVIYLEVDDKFLGEQGCFITAATPIYKHIPARARERCSMCGEFSEFASKPDGGQFVCRPCRENPYR